MLSKRISVVFFLLFLFTLSVDASAESANATLKVSVIDASSQRALVGVSLTLISRDGDTYSLTSNDLGEAELGALPAGLYELRAKRKFYTSVRQPSVCLIENKTTPLSLALIPSENELEEVLVLGNNSGGSRLAPVSAVTLDREALRSAAGSGSDVLRALDGLPGLFSDGSFSSYSVRGNGPRDNLILVDGIPFDRVVHFSDSFGQLEDLEGGGRYSVFAPNVVGSAEFQPGGWGPAYGGRAGSLLKLDVAEGNPDTASYTARLDVAGLEVGYDGPLGENSSLLFSARQLNFGRLFELVGLDSVGEPELTDVIIKTRTDVSNDDVLKFLVIYAPESYSRDIDNVLASDEETPGVYEDVITVESESENSLVTASWTKLIGNNAELINRVYHRVFADDTFTGEAFPDAVPLGTPANGIPVRFPIITALSEETETGWRLDFSYNTSIGRFSSGLRVSQTALDFSRSLDDDWIRYEYDQNDFRPDPTQRFIVLTPEAVNTESSVSGMQYAAFANQAFSIADLEFRTGLRFERDALIEDDELSPRVSVSWQASDKTRWNLTAGRYVQSPRFDDRAADETNTLSYEKNDQLTIGFKYRLSEKTELFVEPYYQLLSDRVVQQDLVNQLYANSGEGQNLGVDIAINRYFENGWQADATYSFNRARLKDFSNAEEYNADYNRPHSASVGGVWEINDRWKISGRTKWASGRPFDDFIVYDNVLGDTGPLRFSKERISNNTERYGSYSSVNVRADYRRSLGRTQVIAFIDIINLFGSENPGDAQFNERTGENVVGEGQSIPLFGLRFEW